MKTVSRYPIYRCKHGVALPRYPQNPCTHCGAHAHEECKWIEVHQRDEQKRLQRIATDRRLQR